MFDRRPLRIISNGLSSVPLDPPPPPVPEPPRLVNIQPSVPDLSITCENSGLFQALQANENIRQQVLSAYSQPLRKSKVPINFNNEEILRLLRSHDEQLRKISENIEELLRVNQGESRRTKPKTRSVKTMTGAKICKEKPDKRPDSSGRKEFAPKLGGKPTESEMRIKDHRPVRHSCSADKTGSLSGSNSGNLDQLLANISDHVNEIIRSSDTSDLDSHQLPESHSKECRRKRSPTLIDCRNRVPSEQTIVINQLASKYLGEEDMT